MERYSQVDSSSLQAAVVTHDPLEFVLMEDMLRSFTVSRVPRWKPSLMMTPGGWEKYKRGRELVKQVDELIDTMWVQLVEGILQARNDMVHWQAGERLRQLQWAESMRQQREQADLQLNTARKQLVAEHRIAELADGRLHAHEIALTKLRHVYDKELEALRQNQNDPAHRARRYQEAVAEFKSELESIANSNHTTAVKNQLAKVYLDALKLVLQ